MTPAPIGELLAQEGVSYAALVLSLYVELPETPHHANAQDQRQARRWFDAGIPLPLVETALVLGSLRRLERPTDAPSLGRIRSLAYFHPVIEELLQLPISPGYLDYLRSKLRAAGAHAGAADVQKTTLSGDR